MQINCRKFTIFFVNFTPEIELLKITEDLKIKILSNASKCKE